MCGNCGNGTYCNKENGTCPAECQVHWNGSKCDACEDGYFGLNCDRACRNCIGNNCYQDNGICSNGCKERWTGANCDTILLSTEPNTGAIVGGLMTVFILLTFAVIIVIAVLRRQYAEKERENTGNVFRCVEYDSKINHGRKKYANIAEYYNLGHISTVIRTQDLQDIIAFKGSEKQHPFIMEYKRLPPGDVSKCSTAQKKDNVTKNRFKTTFPYEYSRVVLGEKWDLDDNDYINANYIKDFKGERRYIAAQGPRENTVTDFLKMIWQENIQCIVMLTNLVEDGKKKCAKYWPDIDMSKNIGQCTLSLLEETVYAFYTFRMFSLQRRNLHDLRIITHFHYTAWPDHDTPEEIALVQFHRAVTKKWKSESPLLVHCSAGVGRTGTFIGLDTLLKQGRETGRINIFEFVKQMREDRMTMVQTVEQYVFLHKALLCGFQERETVISELNLESKLNLLLNDTSPLNQQQLYKEFKFLETIIPILEMECKEDALSSENRSKNVDMGILPVSKYRPFLAANAKGRNEYINAVIVPSFTHPAGFILTQKPLPDTEIDLWRLCMDYQVGEMVVLNGFDEGKTQSMDVFQIYSKNDDEVIKVVEMLLEKEKESTMTSIVISKDGAGVTGLFCVLHNALQQLRMDGEVDIFTIVRQLQTRRPEVINKLEDYRKCYQLVSRSVSTSGTYANM
ncbi:receptor-type tyrosine-protein phosphatase mu-like [Saccostrea echinata]|uniref:receptor-type tyrosine-protein phosphatase mu-like n=1 Tax=Saccostrea echinata TaxID=191078 RepID=UPI002A838A12|nr:receptor-type tyrosine-protein phosphatase mu-like [Saccostrea echinata]